MMIIAIRKSQRTSYEYMMHYMKSYTLITEFNKGLHKNLIKYPLSGLL